MTCTNWGLSVLAVVIFLVAVWPGWFSETMTMWIVGIASVLIIVLTWTCVTCKPCSMKKETNMKNSKMPKPDMKKSSKNMKKKK